MREKMIKLEKILGKRIFAAVLALLMILQCCMFMPLPVSAASYAEASGKLNVGNSVIRYDQKLVDNGDGSYLLSILLHDNSKLADNNQDPTKSQNGYFTAPADGDYLVELWGGNGGDGVASSYAVGGSGGEGGHIYGVVSLKRGETLYYALGGNGQATTSSDRGGGANGNGGNAGASTTYTVGGGGGYSAVFKFAAGEFESKYLNENGDMVADFIREEDRTSKYIMIAGGGGGGGAGSGSFIGMDSGKAPDGGNGGSVGSMSMILPDGSICFYGDDGQSTGNSTAYVGKGATEVPGSVENTIFDTIGIKWFAGIQPNDWYQSYNGDFPGGNGGAGNLRGGSGGAGYCGGSGGVQTSILYPTNVGGGGGASSYIGAGIDYTRADLADMLHTRDKQGGQIYITALINDQSTTLGHVSLTLTPSQYFTVEGITANVDANGAEDGTYTVSGLYISEEQTVTVTFVPKPGFAGGNGVPLLVNNTMTLSAEEVDSHGSVVNSNAAALNLAPACAAVNVPLSFTVNGHSYMTNSSDQAFRVADLYTDNYANVRDSLGDHWEYDFISSISPYGVYETDIQNPLTGETVTPGETTTYTVFFTVEPKNGTVATVGTPVKTRVFTGPATISVVKDGTGWLGGNAVTYQKNLSYDEHTGEYVLKLDVNITSDSLVAEQITKKMYTTNGTYQVPASGYYFIQAWGGDGGNGGTSWTNTTAPKGGYGAYLEGYVYLTEGDSLSITLGEAGKNGETESFNLIMSKGTGGAGGTASSVVLNKRTGGSEPLLIAAGGGGAGGHYRNSNAGIGAHDSNINKYGNLNGYNVEASQINENGAVTYTTGTIDWNNAALTDVLADATNNTGGPGEEGKSEANAAPGAAGTSYYNSSVINQLEAGFGFTAEGKAKINGLDFDDHRGTSTGTGDNGEAVYGKKAGAVQITCLQLKTNNIGSIPENYSYLARIARYWDVKSTRVYQDGGDWTDAYTTTTTVLEQEGEFYQCTDIVLADLDPDYDTEDKTVALDPSKPNEVITKKTYTTQFVVEVRLKPKAEFAGGNDVPILVDDKVTPNDQMPLKNGMQLRQIAPSNGLTDVDYLNINVSGQGATDFANVALNPAALEEGLLNPIVETSLEDRTIDKSNPDKKVIAPDSVYEWTPPKDVLPEGDQFTNRDWRYAFIEYFQGLTRKGSAEEVSGELDLDQSTVFTATVGIRPRTQVPEDAVVVDAVGPVSISEDIDVIVLPRIQYILANATTSDTLTELSDGWYVSVAPNMDHIATLTADPGYRLQDMVTVTKNGLAVTADFDRATGRLTIPGAALDSGTVVVQVTAVENTYTVTFMAQQAPGSVTFVTTEAGSFKAGVDLSGVQVPTMPQVDGYEFVWDWGNGATEMPVTMPGKNLIVTGGYKPLDYTLTIEYVVKDTNEVLHREEKQVAYQSEYSFDAAQIDGYMVTSPTITGMMDQLGGKTVQIVCVPKGGQLAVTYQYANGYRPSHVELLDISTGSPYSVNVVAPAGYTCKITDAAGNELQQIAGTATAEDVANGLSFRVTYYPKQYKVTFLGNGGTLEDAFYTDGSYQITVEFHGDYGLNKATGKLGFPRGSKPGYSLQFWFIDANGNGVFDSGETKIATDTQVTFPRDIELTASWQAGTGYAVLLLVDENGNNIYHTYVNEKGETVTTNKLQYTGQIDTSRVLTAPEIDGYEVIENGQVEVTFAPTSQQITVRYRSTIYTLTIQYQYIDGSKAADTYTQRLSVGENYAVVSPVIDGYTANLPTVSGTIGYGDYTTTVTYTKDEDPKVISVTVTWSDLTFLYEHGKWDPETHTYEDPTITPMNNLGNRVSVKNNDQSTISVWAEYSFSATGEGAGLTGYYTEGAAYYTQKITGEWLLPGQQQTVYFWLDDRLPRDVTGNLIVGNCRVTIRETEQGG